MWGMQVSIFHVHWHDDEPFIQKRQRLLDLISNIEAQGHRVSLVGVSAGASLMLNAFIQKAHAIHRMVAVCGKILHPETVSAHTYRANPAFKSSMDTLAGKLGRISAADRQRILSIHPLYDGSVPAPDTKLPGVRLKTVPTVGHAFSIAWCITVGSYGITRFIKR